MTSIGIFIIFILSIIGFFLFLFLFLFIMMEVVIETLIFIITSIIFIIGIIEEAVYGIGCIRRKIIKFIKFIRRNL